MPVRFVFHPYHIPLPAKAITYLDAALRRTPANCDTLPEILASLPQSMAQIYLIYDGEEMMGATILQQYDASDGKVLSPLLLGGRHISSWRGAYQAWLSSMADSMNASIEFIGRRGWGKLFPMYKEIGTVYHLPRKNL